MRKINLETCDREALRSLGVVYTDREVRRMSASSMVDDWTEVHADPDPTTLPEGAVILDCGAFWGSGCVAVRDGRVVDRAFNGACPWWDDDISSLLCIPEQGEALYEFSVRMDSFSFCYEDDDLGLPRKEGDWGWGTPMCFNYHLFRASWLREIGANIDADKVAELEAEAEKATREAEKATRRARYEAARDRAEFLYPYDGSRVFKAHIPWALEEGVAEAAKALAPHVKYLGPELCPLGGWRCHYRQIPKAWFRAYGWGAEKELDTLMGVCSRLSQPRLSSAWEVACVLAR